MSGPTPTAARGRGGDAVSDWTAAVCVAALAALLVLPSLGRQPLWQDEAQTAVIARTILDHGVPLGSDGRNQFSQELGKEYASGRLWRWHTWLSFYAVAGAFLLLGETTAAARLPFALCGIVTAGLCVLTAARLWRDRVAAAAAGLLCALSVPFLIFSRQCRYYTLAALLSLAALRAYLSLGSGSRAAAWGLGVVAVLLFHAHYVYCATLLASLLLHALLFERARLRPLLVISALVVLVNLPWIVWFAGVRPGGDRYFATVLDAGKLLRFTGGYIALLGQFLPPWLLAVPPLVFAWHWRRRDGRRAPDRDLVSGVGLILVYCFVSILLLSALSPLLFYRYLAPLAPALFLLGGLLLASLYRITPWLAAAAGIALIATSPLSRYLHELRSPPDGPIAGLVAFLDAHADPHDVVAISYGDMPLKFYTPLRVIGGLTGESLDGIEEARWIVPRHYTNTGEDARIKALLEAMVRAHPERYRRHVLAAPDMPFENREDPRLHRFRSAPRRVPRVVVFERLP